MTAPTDFTAAFLELGGVTLGLAVLARISSRWSFSAIPLYLMAGLAFGNGGFAPLFIAEDFSRLGAEIGILLLLFMLGLEYSGAELKQNLRSGLGGGAIDLLLNFPPGFIAGLILGWNLVPALLLGGVTFISSSGIISRFLSEQGRLSSPETPTVVSILVLEDLVMAVYLPLTAVLIAGETSRLFTTIGIAGLALGVALFVAIRYGHAISVFLAHQSDEVILLTIFGSVLLVAGIAQKLHVSAAVGAFLVGIAISSPIAEQSRRLLSPLRDLFAAIFFFFFGLEVDLRKVPQVLDVALALAAVTVLTKLLTGYLATRGLKLPLRPRLRAGLTLVAHGEFSIVIAGLGVAIEPRLGTVCAAYVMLMAILGPITARIIH